MGIDYYGSCMGTAASKYNLWLGVEENSQSTNENKSNLTINLFLKRNDGYVDSAYNLYEDQNSVKLTVGGVVKVNKALKIDTRNNQTVLLAQWTGDLSHREDGTLSVPIRGEFTMGNSTLTGGQVSCNFVCSTIARKSTLTLSSATVNPGGKLVATISSAASGFSHRIIWSLGNNSYTADLKSGVGVTEFTVPVEWINSIVNASKGNISVKLITFNGAKQLGTSTYSVSLVIPATDEYKPSFEIGLTKLPSKVPEDWDMLVQNVSRLSVEPVSLSFKYGASLSAITITIGAVSIRKLPAIFNLTESGELIVTVAVRDTRGILTVKTTTIEVLPYKPPSVNIISLTRCNSLGETDVYGTYLSVRYTLDYSYLNGKNSCTLNARYKTCNDSEYSAPCEIVSESSIIGDGMLSVNNSLNVCFSLTDALTSEAFEVVRSVPSAAIPFNIKKGGRGASFGKFAREDNQLSVGWDLSVDGNVNIKGNLNFQEIECQCTESSSELIGVVRYYPCFGCCFVRMRVKINRLIAARESNVVAKIPDKAPGIFTPLNCFVGGNTGTQCAGGISYQTGEIIISPDKDIPENSYVYISGIYIV